jgi:hypothetical protein
MTDRQERLARVYEVFQRAEPKDSRNKIISLVCDVMRADIGEVCDALNARKELSDNGST